MRHGTNVVVLFVGLFLLLIGGAVILIPLLSSGIEHERTRDLIGAAAMGLGALFLAFGDPKQATDAVRGWLPWGKAAQARRSSASIALPDDPEPRP